MKTFLKILAGLALFAGALLLFVFWLTAGLPDAADKFLKRIAAKDYEGAMALTTPDFRASTDRAALEAFARSNGLEGYQSASWSSREVNNNVGSLKGSLTVTGGGVIPITISLVKSDDGWRIQNLKKAEGGAITDTPGQTPAPATSAAEAPDAPNARAPDAPNAEASDAPNAEAQAQLVAETLSAFAASVNAKDFTGFYDSISSRWQAQTSAEKLRESFGAFIDQEIDLTVVDGMQPNIDASAGIQADGTLHLTGHYPTEPSRTSFDLQYELEDAQWKIINIDIDVR